MDGNLEEWIVCCSQRFFPMARRIARDDRLAEDALQVSWIKILQSINDLYFDGLKACPWVSRIVVNSAKNDTVITSVGVRFPYSKSRLRVEPRKA